MPLRSDLIFSQGVHSILIDAREVPQEKANNTFDEVDSLSHDEELFDIDDGDESRRHGRKGILPPPA